MIAKAKTKKTKTQSVKENLNLAPDAQKLISDILPYTPQQGDITTELQPNQAKVDVMQPSLLGIVKFGQLACSLALWHQETRDHQRQYYKCSVSDAVAQRAAWQRKEKVDPLHRLSLYEFRQRETTDPDFATTEPFIQNGQAWWAMMWVVMPNPEDVESYRYFMAFSKHRLAGAWSSALRTEQGSSAERLLQRRKELEDSRFFQEQQAKRRQLDDADEIPM
jgi:hypothetical protein